MSVGFELLLNEDAKFRKKMANNKNPEKVTVEDDTNTKYSSYAGKSMPMNEKFPHFSMIGVFEKYPEAENGIKFVKITSKQFVGKYTVLLFMDNRSSELEIKEWHLFSGSLPEFKKLNASVVGVCTDSHVAVRSFMTEHHLQGIKFPIISDRDGDFSRSFGVLKIYNDETGADSFGAARAMVILNEDMKMVYLALNNETTPSKPDNAIGIIRTLKTKDPNCTQSQTSYSTQVSPSEQSKDEM